MAAARETLRLDLNAGTSGNVSARLPDGRIVVTPSALPYDDLTPDDLVLVDLDGTVLAAPHRPSGELALHLACYRALPGARAVVHTHPLHATMFACLGIPVPAIVDEFALYAGGDVRCADYAPSGSERLGANAVAALGPRARRCWHTTGWSRSAATRRTPCTRRWWSSEARGSCGAPGCWERRWA